MNQSKMDAFVTKFPELTNGPNVELAVGDLIDFRLRVFQDNDSLKAIEIIYRIDVVA